MPTLIEAAIEAFFQLLSAIISLFVMFLPSLIASLVFLIIGLAVYYFGKKKNLQLMDQAFDAIQKGSGSQITRFDLVEESTIGRTYLAEIKSEALLQDFRIHFTMVHRHLPLSKIASILRRRSDNLLIEAEPKDKVMKRYQLEIIPRSKEKLIKALVKMLERLEPLDLGSAKFDEFFITRVNDSDFFEAVFEKETNLIKNLYSQRENIVRFSLYPLESPSIRLVANLNEQIAPKRLMNILFDFTASTISLGKKGFHAKKRTAGLRIIKDETLEKDKYRFEKRFEE